MEMHPSLTPDRILAAVQDSYSSLSNPGFCVKCGEEHDGCEPDARNYKCDHCGERAVFGAEELMFHFV